MATSENKKRLEREAKGLKREIEDMEQMIRILPAVLAFIIVCFVVLMHSIFSDGHLSIGHFLVVAFSVYLLVRIGLYLLDRDELHELRERRSVLKYRLKHEVSS